MNNIGPLLLYPLQQKRPTPRASFKKVFSVFLKECRGKRYTSPYFDGTYNEWLRYRHSSLLDNIHTLQKDPIISQFKPVKIIGVGWHCIAIEVFAPNEKETIVLKLYKPEHYKREHDPRFDIPVLPKWKGRIQGIKNYQFHCEPLADTSNITKQEVHDLAELISSLKDSKGKQKYEIRTIDFYSRNQTGRYKGKHYLLDRGSVAYHSK